MSLKEIAKIVGTSPSTVSRVLNNSYSRCASKELKDKIWKVAREINYVPNSYAQGLKKGKEPVSSVGHILIVLARTDVLETDPFFYELYKHIEIELFSRNYTMDRILNSNEITTNIKSNGIIILGRCSKQLLNKLKNITDNLIGIWRNSMNFDIDEVICDGKKASSMAIEYLLDLGHRKIAYIGDCSYESRYVGYCDTLINKNIPINYSFIIPTNQTEEEGYNAMVSILKNNEITAVLCANDATAIGALKALQKGDLSKKAISVISIDNIEEAQSTNPLLTTVNIPREDMAHMAVSVLIDRIKCKHKEHVRIEFPCKIVVRDSCYLNIH